MVCAVQLSTTNRINDGRPRSSERAIVSFSHRTGGQYQRSGRNIRCCSTGRSHRVISCIRSAQCHSTHTDRLTRAGIDIVNIISKNSRFTHRYAVAAYYVGGNHVHRRRRRAVVHFIYTGICYRQSQLRDRAVGVGIAAAGQTGTQVIVVSIITRQSQITECVSQIGTSVLAGIRTHPGKRDRIAAADIIAHTQRSTRGGRCAVIGFTDGCCRHHRYGCDR